MHLNRYLDASTQGIKKINLNVFYFMLKVNFPWAMYYYTEVQRVSFSRTIIFKDTASVQASFFYLYYILKKSCTAVTRWVFASYHLVSLI